MEILTLGEKIKSKRKEMNMTLKELAGDRITPGQISLVETGKSKPSVDLLEYISDRLNTDIEYFLESEEKQATTICNFYINIAEAAISAGNTLRAEETIEKGRMYAQKYNLIYLKGKFDMAYSMLAYKRKDYETAQQYCISATGIFLKSNSLDDTVKSFILQGKITLEMGYTSVALNYFLQGDSILNENNYSDERLKAYLFYYIALCHYRLGNNNQAIDYALLARDRIKTICDSKRYAETLMILSIAYSQEGKLEEALKYAKKAKEIFYEINNASIMADMETDLGVIFAAGSNMDESFIHLREAVRIKRNVKDDDVADVLLKMCENYININDLDNAEKLIQEINDSINEEQREYRIKCFKCQYRIYQKKGMNSKAEEVLLNAVRYTEGIGCKKEIGDFYTLLGQFYMSVNESQLALNYIMKGIDIYTELGVILNNDKFQ